MRSIFTLCVCAAFLGACTTSPPPECCGPYTPRCGDGVTDANEACDGAGESATCNLDCTLRACGDGKVNHAAGEVCDDGNTANGDGCSALCAFERCGDGVTNDGEACDAAGESATCNLDCTARSCGDGKVNGTAGEECDAGALNADNRDCTAGCKLNICNDGHVNTLGPNHVEACDDHNAVDTDGCTTSCHLPHCGNGVLDPLEACDDGNTANGDGCSSLCAFERCGDGIVNDGEACDDGGESATCNLDCTVRSCGDGKVNGTAHEECDDGGANADNRDCTSSCHVNVCGDGHPDTLGPNHVENCDGGGALAAGCNLDCTLPSCGDGKVNPLAGEQCDDANQNHGDGCYGCQFELCGNNTIDVGEECDGLSNPGPYACSADCFFQKCGNGRLDPGEECDDGNISDGDNCLSGNPDPATCKVSFCGDGQIDLASPTVETCDDGNNIDETTCVTVDCLSCSADCTTILDLTGH